MGLITEACLLIVLLNVLQKREIKCVNATAHVSEKGAQERKALVFCLLTFDHLCIFRNCNQASGRSFSLAREIMTSHGEEGREDIRADC